MKRYFNQLPTVCFLTLFMNITLNAQVFDTLVLIQEEAIQFESDAWKLLAKDSLELDSIVPFVQDADSVFLEGHTDNVGSIRYNQKLSEKRTESIKEYFLNEGIESSKFWTSAHGELRPIVRGQSEQINKINRRVTIGLYENQTRRRIKGQIVDKQSSKGIEAVLRLKGRDFEDSIKTDADGYFSFSAPDDAIYKLNVIAKDYFFHERFIKIAPLEPFEINIEMPKPKIGDAYVLPNFNFKPGVPILLKKSVPTLNLLYESLANSTICIEIKGHINEPNAPHVNTKSSEYILSVDRAEMVFDAMVKKGISSDRMLPRGYGNWEMLYPTTKSEAQMILNRRVEIIIIDCNSEILTTKKDK
ncbi:MAG: OmpA family protein [Saprospiraceae bacterium]|nr:OmpA family protein [Saprospiraceae bacterium]